MRNCLRQVNQESKLSKPLAIRVGVNTGLVIAGPAGTGKNGNYTVTGDAVIVASQLKDLSPDGQIYAGSSTYKYTKTEFEYKRLSINLPGKACPVLFYALLSTQPKIHRASLGLDRMIYSEMVGREKELSKLELHVLKVINGEGSVVSVVIEAHRRTKTTKGSSGASHIAGRKSIIDRPELELLSDH
jgi:adenylate cyclase